MNWWIDSDVVELGFETATRKRCNGKETDIPKHLTILTTLFGGLSSNKDIWQSLHLYQTTSISCQPYTAADDPVNRIARSLDLQSGYSDVPHFFLRFMFALEDLHWILSPAYFANHLFDDPSLEFAKEKSRRKVECVSSWLIFYIALSRQRCVTINVMLSKRDQGLTCMVFFFCTLSIEPRTVIC